MSGSKGAAAAVEASFVINDHVDILVEVLKRVDGRSLGVAACVCRLWCSITRNDSLWEHMCFGPAGRGKDGDVDVRPVVLALGGYRRLYMVSLRPVLDQWRRRRRSGGGGGVRRRREEVQLSLSLFCVDYYERLGVASTPASSLMFLNNNNNNSNHPNSGNNSNSPKYEYPINV